MPAFEHPSAVPTMTIFVDIRGALDLRVSRKRNVSSQKQAASPTPRTVVLGERFSNWGHNSSGVHETLPGAFRVFLFQLYTLKPK